MQINTTVTREYYAQERYYSSKQEPFTVRDDDLMEGEEVAADHRTSKTAEECFDEMNSFRRSVVLDDLGTKETEPLGMGFILVKGGTGYGMTASQVVNPDFEDAVVRVKVASGETYDVKISEVDPKNATAVEMFAYCQYADANGMGINSHFGSWNAMKSMMMGSNGEPLELDSLEDATTKKMDWQGSMFSSKVSMLNQKTGETLSAADIIEMFERMQKAAVDRDNEKNHKNWRDMSEKEWDKLLDGVDDKIEDMKESVQEEAEKTREASERQENFDSSALLTARYTTFEQESTMTDPKTGQPITVRYTYRNYYTKEGIIAGKSMYDSREAGIKDTYSWKVEFNSEEDYERAMKFLDRIPEGDITKFLTREDFWQDFVNGDIDEDEFFEYYETLDHGKANFLKKDENGNTYVDKEMMSGKFYKYFGIEQLRSIPWDELQRGLELSALKERGFDHNYVNKKEDISLYASLREVFGRSGSDGFRFEGEEETYSLDEWVSEIIRRLHFTTEKVRFA